MRRKSPVPRNDQVSVTALAAELDTTVDRIQALIDQEYLRVIQIGLTADTTIVARPAPAALAWLKTMFQPLRMRPLFPLPEVAQFIGQPLEDIRAFCLHFNVPIYSDPVFGELLTIAGMHTLTNAVHEDRKGYRFDRQALLLLLASRRKIHPRRKKPLNYGEALEMEIKRICRMEEPDRTLRAAALYMAYTDAKTVTACMTKYVEHVAEMSKEEAMIERRIKNMMDAMEGRRGWGLDYWKKRKKQKAGD